MDDLRSIVSKGDNIYAARKKIEGRYHYVSKVYDPTKQGDKLWMDVNFGLQSSYIEAWSYAADITPPAGKNRGLGALIEADEDGTILDIR